MSSARAHVRIDQRAGGTIAFLTVDNQAKLNTLDRALMAEFIGKVEGLGAREDLRALVLSGAGDKAFIGGASIPEMAALDPRHGARFHHAGAPELRRLAPAAGPGDCAHRRLCARRRAGSGGVLRSAGSNHAREIRHAGDEGRHSLGGRSRAHSAVGRLRPRARAVDAGRDHRRGDRAALGPGRARGRACSARRGSREDYRSAADGRPAGGAQSEGADAAVGKAADRQGDCSRH